MCPGRILLQIDNPETFMERKKKIKIKALQNIIYCCLILADLRLNHMERNHFQFILVP